MRDRAPTIATGAARKLLEALPAAGADPSEILAEVGLDAAVIADRDARIPVERIHALWNAALRRAPRFDAALFGAESYTPGDYGLVGFVAMNSATLGEAARHVVRYLGLWTDDPEFTLHDDGTLSFAYRTRFADSMGFRLATEAAPAEVLHGARLITQRRITAREVRFVHPAPADRAAHDAFFGCRVRFGAKDNAIVFHAEDFALPLPKADAQLGAFLRGIANEALEKRGGAEATALDRLRQIIAEDLQQGVPSLGQVAQRLATSERTLRRRLDEQGTSFRELLDETRAQLARSYVRDPRIPLAEVAFLLGFSEPSAFHRAFKRWTSATPASFRARGG
jgi:AraC-like DNA-binding protein